MPGAAGPPAPLAVDGSGDIYVAGGTGLPKLHGQDGTIAYAAALPGAPNGIFVDPSGQALVTVSTFSPLVTPTPGAYASPLGEI